MIISSDMANLPDKELLRLINIGDQRAFVCVYDRYWSEMYACAFKISANHETCEDLIHDVFISLWNSKTHLNIISLRDYLYIAVKNKSLNKIRSKHKNHEIIDESHYNIPSLINSDDPLGVKEINDSFEKTLTHLPDKCREIILLSRKEHLSNKEIASRLGISSKTVENQINIGLKKIRLGMADFLLLYFFYFFFGC